MEQEPIELVEKDLCLLNEILDKNFDWIKHREISDDDTPDVFSRLYRNLEDDESIMACGCGSVRLDDTAKSLYRILFLLQSKEISFGDMYKRVLFALTDPAQKLLVYFELYKYEAALRFYCPAELTSGAVNRVTCGVPGSDNGTHCADSLSKKWFNTLTRVLNTELRIYDGNNFKV